MNGMEVMDFVCVGGAATFIWLLMWKFESKGEYDEPV